MVDLAYTTQIQLKLAYDIAVLYGVPLDLEDPEEDAEWVAARLGVDGTRGIDFRDWSMVGQFI